MKWVNRSVIIIRPKQPFVDWINNTPELEIEESLALDYFKNECTAILVPDLVSNEDVEYYLGRIKSGLFELELAGWYTDPSVWPAKRDSETFDKWFELEVHSMVYDLFQEPMVDNEQAWRIIELLEDTADDREALPLWEEYLQENLELPLIAEVQESYMLGPLRQGDYVRVANLAGSDPLYGVLAKVHKGDESYVFPLCNLAAMVEQGDNHQLVNDYTIWFRSK